MNELLKLTDIVTNGANLNQSLPLENGRNSKEKKFIENLKSKNYNSDEAAALDIYGTTPNDVRYKMLKHRMKKKLYNKLILIDFNKLGFNNHYQKEHECITLLHQAHILKREYELDLVINLSNKVIAIAEEFDFTNHLVSALELKSFCYTENGNVKMFDKTIKELEAKTEKLNKEMEAVRMYQTVKLYLKKSITTRKNLIPKVPSIVAKLELIWQQTRSFNAFEAYYKTSISYYELEGDFDKIVEMTVASFKWVEEGLVNKLLFNTNYNKFILVYAHLRSKKYEDGLKYAELYCNDFRYSSVNWFSFMENYFLLALHCRQYELAWILLRRVFENPSYKIIAKSAKERWSLYQAYYGFIAPITTAEISLQKNPYGLSLPEYSKDKLGFNVAILILQFIYFLQKEDSEALLYRIESLKKYILTHLKDTFSLRSKTFLKLLILTVTEDFEADACKKKGQKLYQRLIETPPPGDAYAEIEIVPYEHLWEHILSILESKS
ncbi:hypothetical protein DXT99_15225 [Pontibacter diazotrophicus]|uniref:Uncharacterized protein n=1 Tax=Pontibacter diazotrophicus TaxID=1400979 RepID=A0A3D8LA70_9BACT|nr:hypothetical protein [Pontibacter diazotrophicus]RDV14278.1 hypothetical protein DXT99_15225 [Pontibacter diazotrophicus]